VEFLTYYNYYFYRSVLDKANIPHTTVTASNKPGRIVAVRKAIRHQKPDVVIAYQETPSLFAELAGLPKRDFALIVSERSFNLRENFATKRRFFFHRLSDAVVCNSFTQTKFIAKTSPWLAKRTATIINCVDIYKFKPADVQTPADNEPISILVIGNFRPEKNPLALVEAIRIVARNLPQKVTVDWYGNNWFKNGSPTKDSELYLRVQKFIKDNKLDDVFRLHDFVSDITPLYQSATAFCLPSLYEGCSNVIGEAMACGKPILASNVSDNPRLVKDGENGFLFNPANPQDIANAIIRFAALSIEQRIQFGLYSRARAEHLLSSDVFVQKYIDVITSVAKGYHK
jgi:glycosyltransferase involved in cell wall biosynthesis